MENWEYSCIFLEQTRTCDFLRYTESVRDSWMRMLGRFREKHFSVYFLQLETGSLQLPSMDLQNTVYPSISADAAAQWTEEQYQQMAWQS